MKDIKEENIDFWKNHSSYAYQYGVKSNDSLATLGDAVIGLIVVEYFYEKNLTSGDITIEKSKRVSDENFAKIAKKIELDKELRLGKGMEKQKGRDNEKILEQIFEAYIGFKYLTEGLEKTKNLVIDYLIISNKP
ncbi:MAG: ribonuclease III domain-containing protein [Candidatus Hodarchaeota archaeon]